MRLEIRYVNRFVYPTPARESHNVLRACPADDGTQRLLDFDLSIDPTARVLTYVDSWGTRVDAFGIRAPHERLLVTAEAVVETSARPAAPRGVAGRSDYADPEIRLDLGQYLRRTGHTAWDSAIETFARDVCEGIDDATDAVAALDGAVRDAMTYTPGATEVGVDITNVWATRQGVCQDFAHLAIAMYRSLGIPARYVSGYIYASDLSGGDLPDQAEVEIETHAWVEVLVPGFGWWGLDPTNPQDVGERHVKIGHGRDYDDVMPLRGVYHGPSEHTLSVGVQISREGLTRRELDRMQQAQAQQ
ncbi:MAG: transglutaminase family protein [Acidimicrobiia bacterium]|nr:transglutaminase family protein [Acidimicrobiia bacterium]